MSKQFKVASFEQTEDHLERFNRSINQVRSQVAEAERRAKNVAREEANKRANELRREISVLEYNLNDQLSNVSDEVRLNYIEHKKSLANQANQFNQQLANLKDWTRNSLDSLHSEMDNRFAEQQTQINFNRQAIQDIYNRENDREKQAQLRLNDLKELLDVFDKNNNHNKFAEGKYAQLIRRFNYTKDLPSQSIIANTSQITNTIFDLEEQIAKEKMIFESIHNQTLSIAEELLLEINNNRSNLYFIDENGKEIKDEEGNQLQVEVDFWTEDEYSKIEMQLKSIKAELESQKESPELDKEELELFQEQLSNLKDQQEKLVILACEKGLLSMDRDDIANDILEAFEKQGFLLKSEWDKTEETSIFYEGNSEKSTKDDQRESIAINILNDVGTELTIRVVPNGRKNIIHFHRNDNRNMTQQEYMELLEEVKKIIEDNGNGYKMGQMKAPKIGDVRIEELADMNALRKGLKKEIKNIK